MKLNILAFAVVLMPAFLPMPTFGQAVTKIAAGSDYSLFLKSDGSLWAMGNYVAGQLGDGTFINTNKPEQIVASEVTAIAAGGPSLFIKSDGSLWGMGQNSLGELGDGTFNFTNKPEQIVASGVTAVAAGGVHALFLKTDGSLWAMGDNRYGELGDGTFNSTNRPEQILADGVMAISVEKPNPDAVFSLLLKSDGSLWAMGDIQLNSTFINTNKPEKIVASGVTAIAAGGVHALFLKTDGSLWAMGDNYYGELGDGTYPTNEPYGTNKPEQIIASGVTAIAAGVFYSLFLKSDGSLWAMGNNADGELGDGTYSTNFYYGTNKPEQIVASGVTAIASGGFHSLFLKSDGSLWAMGDNYYGELGDDTTNNRYSPVLIVPPVSSAPIIVSQPQSHTISAGNTIIFNMAAVGTSPLTYQWKFNSQNIPNATNATLTLNSVTAANSGGYSVVVSNPYGSVTSATASLAVLTDGANGNKPVPITATPNWSKPSTVKNLVFVTHGWQPVEANPFGPPAQPWMTAMTDAIAQQLGGNGTWQFETYDWTWASWTLEPQQALSRAEYTGALLGKAIAGMGYQQVHLIAHSAGSGMIQAIADQLKASPNPPQIQLTFLDPYIGIFHQEQNNYGKNADWSDCYSVEDGTGGFTGSYLSHAFNVDVSWVDPAHTAWPYVGLGGGKVALSSHGYPIDFYLGSITGGNSSCSSAYGFSLSQEMEGVFWFNNQANDPVGNDPFLPCSPPDAVKNPTPGIAGLESGIAGIPTDISAAANAVGDATKSVINGAGAELQSIWSQLSLVQSGGIRPLGGPVSTNIPAWLAVGMNVTNAVNFVQFDAGFTDTNSAQGLLTVYWNTNQIGMVDERVAATNSQTYRFELPGTVSSGLYTLSFRLDSFSNSSSIVVTNVATGFVGLTQPITLAISLTNGSPLLQLTAATNFTYLIQSSTDLVNWTPTALLLNTNGTAQFMDSAVTNSSARFYRAVVP